MEAARAKDWRLAAAVWHELFLQGGEGATYACGQAARALMQMGDLHNAKGVVDQGLLNDPGHAELLEIRGNVLAASGFRRAAEAAYLEALDSDPDSPGALMGLGQVCVELGREDAALAPIERRIQAGADDPATFLLYGRALTACDRPEDAFGAYARAFELGQTDAMCWTAAAALYFDPRLYGATERRDAALAWLLNAVEHDPQFTLAHLYLGRLHEIEGNDGQALARYRRAAETDPSHPDALTRMALTLERLEDPVLAAEIATRALQYQEDEAQRAELERIVAAAPPIEAGS
jgi:tetratricopeptide (TPR) repeat protein